MPGCCGVFVAESLPGDVQAWLLPAPYALCASVSPLKLCLVVVVCEVLTRCSRDFQEGDVVVNRIGLYHTGARSWQVWRDKHRALAARHNWASTGLFEIEDSTARCIIRFYHRSQSELAGTCVDSLGQTQVKVPASN